MTYFDSPQNFVRALKAPADPPKQGDLFKIEIALEAWHTPSFVVPSKAEYIIEFILTRLLKDRSRDPHTDPNPILDVRYWSLLADVLYPINATSPHESIKLYKSWLLPLLNRIPFAPIIVSLLALSASEVLDDEKRRKLYESSHRAFVILWPLAVSKLTADALMDCFGALLGVLAKEKSTTEDLQVMGSMIVSAFRSSLGNISSKRKLYQTFTQSHLESWLSSALQLTSISITRETEEATSTTKPESLFREIYTVGTDVLFNPDTLRAQFSESSSSSSPSFFSPFLSLCSSKAQLSLPSLPHLLESFTSALRKYRTTLFGAGEAGVADVRSKAFGFFEACEGALKEVEKRANKAEVVLAWRTRVELLNVVEKERLFVGGMDDAEVLLKTLVEKAVEVISTSYEETEHTPGLHTGALESLCAISRIDHDLVDSSVPSILSSIIILPLTSPNTSASQLPQSLFLAATALLSLILNYHTQTRTLPTHLARLLAALTPPFSTSIISQSAEPENVYYALSMSPILSRDHLSKLSRACRTFITPGQALSTAEEVLKSLEGAWDSFKKAVDSSSGPEKRHKKRRKSESQDEDDAMDVDGLAGSTSEERGSKEAWAIGFALEGRIVESVLLLLPMRNVPEDVAEKIRRVVRKSTGGFMRDATRGGVSAGHDAEKMDVDEEEGGKRKKKRKRGVDNKSGGQEGGTKSGWARQVVAAASLRLTYAVEGVADLMVNSERKSDEDSLVEDAAFESALLNTVGDEGSLPELRLELFRALFKRASHPDFAHRSVLIDHALIQLGRIINHSTPSRTQWSGRSSQLTYGDEGVSLAAIGLLRLVMDRFLDILDVYASTEQREKLVNILFTIGGTTSQTSVAPTPHGSGLTPAGVLTETLRSADFWERPNLRSALLSTLTARTASLASVDVSQVLSHHSSSSQPTSKKSKKTKSASLTEEQVKDAASAYSFLLYAPSEYVPRSARSELLKRAVALDGVVMSMPVDDDDEGVNANIGREVLLASIRTFLLRTFVHVGAADHQFLGEYLRHLVMSGSALSSEPTHTFVSLELIQIHLLTTTRIAEKEDGGKHLLDVIECWTSTPFHDQSSVRKMSALRLMAMLRSDFNYSGFPAPVQSALQKLLLHITESIRPAVEDVVARKVVDEGTLDAWCKCVLMAKWTGVSEVPSPGLGKKLAYILSSKSPSGAQSQPMSILTCKSVFSVMLAELDCCTESEGRESQLGTIVAAYVLFSRLCGSNQQTQFDEDMTRTSRGLSVPEYSFVLDLVSESLAPGTSEQDLSCLVHLSTLLLHETPEGTMKVVQSYVTKCLDIFVNDEKFYSGSPSLRHQVLTLLNHQCSDNPASIRSSNLPAIWTLLSKFLSSPSSLSTSPHDGQTHPETFHLLTSIISALIRLRRDLVLTTLPHLCLILRRLIFTLRTPRPQLGRKQYSLVVSGLPQWINPSDRPLGPEESKALARLLTTLSTKSVIRTYTNNATHGASAPSTDTQKPESLARPLSKHVAYVLQAYIEVVNDPLCVFSSEMRKELMPGLFVLCGIMGEHARDALMVSALDGGGKMVLKGVWKEYEKQKYVGKG